MEVLKETPSNLYEKLDSRRSLQSYIKYLQRLKTFEIIKWFSKPDCFSPLECARRGWVNLTKDTLKCVSCSNILYFKNQSSWSVNKKSTTISPQKNWSDPNRLISEHNPNCPWRAVSIPDQLIQIDIYDEELIYKNFLDRLRTFKGCFKIPILDQSVLEVFDSLGCLANNRNEISNNYKIIISCCGWSFKGNKNMIQCERCFRSVGLWMYPESTESDGENQASTMDQSFQDISSIFANTQPYSDEIVVKSVLDDIINRIVIEKESLLKESFLNKRKLEFENVISKEAPNKRLNPISEHFNWCPWLTQLDQNVSVSIRNGHKAKRICKNPCFVAYESVCRRLTARNNADSKANKSESPSKMATFSADELIGRVRSAQSLLISCASKFNTK